MWLIIILRPTYPEIHWVKLWLNECLISYSEKDKKYNSNRNIGHWPRCPKFSPSLPSQSGFFKMEYISMFLIWNVRQKRFVCFTYNLSSHVSNRRSHKIRNSPRIYLKFSAFEIYVGFVSHLVRLYFLRRETWDVRWTSSYSVLFVLLCLTHVVSNRLLVVSRDEKQTFSLQIG